MCQLTILCCEELSDHHPRFKLMSEQEESVRWHLYDKDQRRRHRIMESEQRHRMESRIKLASFPLFLFEYIGR
ncbi:hypothetical protein B9Z55_025131 [Caenorhabditis nigoni]|uniref:Uncharacterized protein n=1 Tax=Caenorhabditis nigoni TaxID=1611254 RepID=A0A2G5SX18_9PELO|nr:hypothetical protein B9Z55_025131 [Caenorhabditis nigoni]